MKACRSDLQKPRSLRERIQTDTQMSTIVVREHLNSPIEPLGQFLLR